MSGAGQIDTDTGAEARWGAVHQGGLAANAIHHHLQSVAQTKFVSVVYLQEKGQRLVDALRSMGVEVR